MTHLVNLILFFQKHIDKVAHFALAYFLQDMILMLRSFIAEMVLTIFLFIILLSKELIDKYYRNSKFSTLDLIAGLLGMAIAIGKIIYIINFAKFTFSNLY